MLVTTVGVAPGVAALRLAGLEGLRGVPGFIGGPGAFYFIEPFKPELPSGGRSFQLKAPAP